jgi:hypothetical protein
MVATSSPTFKYITRERPANLRPLTNAESFRLLRKAVAGMGDELDQIITRKMSESYRDLDALLAKHFGSQDHPLSGVRLRVIFDTEHLPASSLDRFFLTEKREWWWIRFDDTMQILTLSRCERLKPKHGPLFKPALVGSNPQDARIALHLLESLLGVIWSEGEKRIERGERLKNLHYEYLPWLEGAREAGFDSLLH